MFVDVDEAGTAEPVVVEDPCPHGIPSWLCESQCPESTGFDDGPGGPVVDLTQAPGVRMAWDCQSAGAVPELLSDGEVLDVAQGADAIIRWAMGLRTRMLATFADRHPAGTSAAPPGADPVLGRAPVSRWLPDEVGLTFGIPRLEASAEIGRAQRFTRVLPDTLAALEHGRIDARRADAISSATAVLPDEKARTVEAAVLAKAPDATLRQLRDRVRRAIVRIDPDGEYRRHKEANTERRISIRSLDDGMASLWFYGPAEHIEGAWQMADRLARALGPQDPRTLDQRRFDLATQILQGRLTVTDLGDVDTAVTATLGATLTDDVDDSGNPNNPGNSGDIGDDADGSGNSGDGPGADPDHPARPTTTPAHRDPPDEPAPPGYRVPPDILADAVAHALTQRPDLHATVRKPLIHVVVGLSTLLGDNQPAELVGHGPINADTARALAAGGIWERLITDPWSGTLLDQGRTTYTPSAGLNGHVRARDQKCRGPHCERRIRDLDHHQEWTAQLGPTAEENLYGYCQHCHLLKDAPGWQVIAHPDRSLTWISPHGRRHTTEPYDYRPYTDPATTDPATTDPATTDPATTDPATTDPATTDAPPDPAATTATAASTGIGSSGSLGPFGSPVTVADEDDPAPF